jgi:hypothetical protein
MKMQTEKVRLATGNLAANVRHTGASYSRPIKMVEAKLASPRKAWGAS